MEEGEEWVNGWQVLVGGSRAVSGGVGGWVEGRSFGGADWGDWGAATSILVVTGSGGCALGWSGWIRVHPLCAAQNGHCGTWHLCSSALLLFSFGLCSLNQRAESPTDGVL